MSDATLFDAPRARATDPETSHQAAAAITGAIENAVLRRFNFESHYDRGLTDDELCSHLRHRHAPTVKTARSRLSKRGLLIDSGERRPSDRGRAQIVWRLAS